MGRQFIPLSVPNLQGNEEKYVVEAIRTEWVSTNGSYVSDFEKKIADYVNVKGAVACQNGTSGLHTALMVCGTRRDDMVIVPTLTFIAAVNPVKYIGAEPIFMDCDDSLCLDPDKLDRFCKNECDFKSGSLVYKKNGHRVNAIVVVHVFGNMADMERIMPIAEKYNLRVVEDATEAIGTYYTDGVYKGKYAGTIGDIGVYSFNGNKIITCGGGGMIVSNNEEFVQHAKHLTTQAKSDTLFYTHDEIGYNYRMTNLQAALGLAQFEQLEKFISTKKENYDYYFEKLSQLDGVKMLGFRDNIRSNRWFYSVYCMDSFRLTRNDLIKYFSECQIQTRPIWGLIHEQTPYEDAENYEIVKAYDYLNRVVNVPCSTNLTTSDIDYVVDCLRKAQN